MTVRSIRKEGDPILRKVAKPVESFDRELRELATDMIQTAIRHRGLGLAAPQVGRSLRLIVVTVPGRTLVLCNPSINRLSGQQASREGCLSVPGDGTVVGRAASVLYEYQDLDGRLVGSKAGGLLAAVLQHEVDHLDGILFTDRIGKNAIKPRSGSLRERIAEGQAEAAPPASVEESPAGGVGSVDSPLPVGSVDVGGSPAG